MNLDPWCILAALSQHTTVRLGTLVACNSYRYPAARVKLAATIDQLSNGGFQFGIGVVWNELKCTAYSIPFPSISNCFIQFAEAIQFIRFHWMSLVANEQEQEQLIR